MREYTTQMDAARKGIITPEMKAVAKKEYRTEEGSIREGTELFFAGDEETVKNAFGVDEVHDHHVFLPHVLSRKKQIVPALSQLWG